MKVWAFNKVPDAEDRALIYESVKNGKSRFGWSYKDEHNLLGETWSDCHSKQWFLLEIEVGDWIVHINTPSWGKCVAAQVTAKYAFDEGLKCPSGVDFRHVIEVDKNSVIEFNRRDDNILPTVNLRPMKRCQRIYAVQDFLTSLENLKQNRVTLQDGESKNLFHLRDETDKFLGKITSAIHANHRGKDLERFLASVFRRVAGVVDVNENGFGWKSDYGADLIITTNVLGFENKIVVQIKSFGGEIYDLQAVHQVKTGIEKYGASSGMIITTAQKTEQLETEILKVSEEIGCQIDLVAGDDVAKFVLKYAPDLLFRL